MAVSTSQGISGAIAEARVEDRRTARDALGEAAGDTADACRSEDLRAECQALRTQLDAARDGAIFAEALEAVSEAIVMCRYLVTM